MEDLEIYKLENVDDMTVIILSHLMSQLVGEKIFLSKEHLKGVVKSDNTSLFLVKEQENIIGTFSLVIYRIPTGLKGSVEDVVVDVSSRGRGIGEYMLKFAIDYARKHKVCNLDLTSRPERIAANLLYQKVGFIQRDTNVYRIKLF